MNKNLKIVLLAGTAAVCAVGAFFLHRSDERAGTVNSVQKVETAIADKTFRTKSEAYEAFANEKETFYHRSSGVFESSGGAADKVAPSAGSEPKKQAAPVTNADTDTQFDEAYREIEREMAGIYDDPEEHPQPTAIAPQVPELPTESAADRRREALLRDWGIDSDAASPSQTPIPTTFRAVIHGTQLLKAGQTALFRMKEPIRYGSLVVPAHTLLSGTTSIAENRLIIKITSVRLGQHVFALPLAVYGSDGMAGLPLDGDVVNKVAGEQTSSTAIQEAGSAASRYGGTIGRVAGTLISGVGNQVRSAKNSEIKLIDNQVVLLKLCEP